MTFQPADWTIKQNPSQNSYTGTIVGVNDPLQSNRAQVKIPFLHNGVPDELLPWFKNGNLQGNVKGETQIKIPVLGARVRVEFENDNFYTGTFYDGYKSQQDIDQEYMQDGNITEYGTFDGHKDQWGNWWKVGNNGTVTFKTNQGVLLEIVGTTIHLSGVTETTVDSSDKITMNTQEFKINAKTSCTIDTPDFNINNATTANINATTTNINATTTTIDGATINLTATTGVNITQDIINSGTKSINSQHKHTGVTAGNEPTGEVQ